MRHGLREAAALTVPRVSTVNALPQPLPLWCLAVNIVDERRYGPDGLETRRGVRIFAGGAKIYLAGSFHCLDALPVVGLSRHPHRLVNAVVHARFLTNWRVRMVYSPAVLRALAAADIGLDLPYRYRQARGLDPRIGVDQADKDYRDWLSEWAALLTDAGERQEAETDRFNRHASEALHSDGSNRADGAGRKPAAQGPGRAV